MTALTRRAVLLACWMPLVGISLALGQKAQNIQKPLVRDDGKVVITYDLEGEPGAKYQVRLYLVRPGDLDLRQELSDVAGDIGRGRSAGRNLKIFWNAKAEYPKAVEGAKYQVEFEVSPDRPLPRLLSVWPLSAKQGERLTLQILGDNFEEGVSSIDLGPGLVLNSLEVRSTTRIQADITVSTDAPEGKHSLRVVNDATRGDASEPKDFTVEGAGGIAWYYYAAGGAVLVGGAVVYLLAANGDSSPTPLPPSQALPWPPNLP